MTIKILQTFPWVLVCGL